MKCGVIGLPNVGKSTLSNALAKKNVAECGNFPFCTIEKNVITVLVHDKRLNVLAEMNHSKKIVPATIEMVDIAGLVRGASQGKGLGNKFLEDISNVHVVAHVIRCFDDDETIHVESSIDPIRDIDITRLELSLFDIDKLEKYQKKNRNNNVGHSKRVLQTLRDGLPLNILDLTEEEKQLLNMLHIISVKPMIYVCNIIIDPSATSLDALISQNQYVQQVQQYAKLNNNPCVVVCANTEFSVSLSKSDQEMDKVIEWQEQLLNQFIVQTYYTLGWITFFTTGADETKAWKIKKNTTAKEAAGAIHSDIERGFICAETIQNGKIKIEGKNYIVQDGDVMLFRFNV